MSKYNELVNSLTNLLTKVQFCKCNLIMINKTRQNFILVILMKTKYLLEYFFFKYHLQNLGGWQDDLVGTVLAGKSHNLNLSSRTQEGKEELGPQKCLLTSTCALVFTHSKYMKSWGNKRHGGTHL